MVAAPAGVLGGVDAHGAELIHFKILLVSSNAFLTEQNGAGGGDVYADRADDHDRRGEQDEKCGTDNVHQTLDSGVSQIVQRNTADVEQGDAADLVKLRGGGDVVSVVGNDRKLDADLFADRDDLRCAGVVLHADGGDDFIGTIALQNLLQFLECSEVSQTILALSIGGIHISYLVEAQFRIGADGLEVGVCQRTGAKNDDVLEVITSCTHGAQDLAQQPSLGAQCSQTDDEEDRHDQTGIVVAMLNEQIAEQ